MILTAFLAELLNLFSALVAVSTLPAESPILLSAGLTPPIALVAVSAL